MSVLFKEPFNGVTIHVLQIRNRPAFLARELGMAAGHSDDGQTFVDLIVHEWAASLDEDDDVAQIVGSELDAIKREVPLPENTTMALVLFATGAERALLRSHARYSRSLIGFLHADVLSRVITLHRGENDGGDQGGAPASPTPPQAHQSPVASPPKQDAVKLTNAQWRIYLVNASMLANKHRDAAHMAERRQCRMMAFEAIDKLAGELRELALVDDEVYGALRIEAVEELLGHPLRTTIPQFDHGGDDGSANHPFAA
jgi:hypothetical protein